MNSSSAPTCLMEWVCDQMALVACGHTFCHGCLLQLFQQSNCKCPICRVEIEGNLDSSSAFASSFSSSTSTSTAAAAAEPTVRDGIPIQM